MIICDNCGSQNPDGERFCQVCGNFLAWQAESRATTTGPAASAATATAATAQTPASEQPVPQVQPVESGLAQPPDPTAQEPLGLVQPGKPVEARPTLREYQEPAAPTEGVICPVCGTVNSPGRQLCRSCGAVLAPGATVDQKVPWWRRVRLPKIGRGWAALRRLLVLALAVLAVLLLIWAGATYGPRAVEAVRDRLATPQPIQPTGATASSSAEGHPAGAVMDGFNNRYWAPAQPGAGIGEYVELGFGKPFRMLSVIIQSGVSAQQDQFVTEARPAQLKLTAWDTAGAVKDIELRLADRPGEQRFDHAVGDVVRLRLTVEAAYGLGDGRRPAIAEIEVFERR